jgi:hypothetical protein
MHKTTFKPHFIFIMLLTGLLCFWSAQAMAQTPPESSPAEPKVTDPPAFIAEIVESSELTQEQVEQMRSDGLGWGNIMIAALLAERIAADSQGVLTFNDALASVLNARAEGKGFGQIALENDLKLGRVVGKGETSDGGNPPPFIPGAGPGVGVERRRNQQRSQNVFRWLLGFLGFERKERPEEPSKPEKVERPDRPERPQRPERPERPERPAKPEKPERPERGFGR